jgi:hypothetical protein
MWYKVLQSNTICEFISLILFFFNQQYFVIQLGGIDQVIVLDCEEDYAKQNAGSKISELDSYKNNTLPALAHFEDINKLEYVSINGASNYPERQRCCILELFKQ